MGQLTADIEGYEGGEGDMTKGSIIIQSKVKLMDILTEKMAEYLTQTDGKGSADIFTGINQQYQVFLQQSLDLANLKLEQATRKKEH